MIRHHFTVDVEDYFQVSAFETFVDRRHWELLEGRLAVGVDRILELLDRHCTRGTFFVLGWAADRHPSVIRRIAEAGHEIASHGWGHRRVTDLTPAEFRESVRRSKATLEDLCTTMVIGYRAPSFSIVPGREWALDILAEEGYRYDSSLFPVRRRGYGYPNGTRGPGVLQRATGPLLEVPPTTVRWGGINLPAAGGAYFRLLPYRFIAHAFHRSGEDGVPGTFYIHPWELDPEQPRLKVSALTHLRHYGGLHRTQTRLERLLSEFAFGPVIDLLANG